MKKIKKVDQERKFLLKTNFNVIINDGVPIKYFESMALYDPLSNSFKNFFSFFSEIIQRPTGALRSDIFIFDSCTGLNFAHFQ